MAVKCVCLGRISCYWHVPCSEIYSVDVETTRGVL